MSRPARSLTYTESPLSNCGTGVEDGEHYLKHCLNYTDLRSKILQEGIDLRAYDTDETA